MFTLAHVTACIGSMHLQSCLAEAEEARHKESEEAEHRTADEAKHAKDTESDAALQANRRDMLRAAMEMRSILNSSNFLKVHAAVRAKGWASKCPCHTTFLSVSAIILCGTLSMCARTH